MRTKLTITSKGQTTLPIGLRKKLGLTERGGVLYVDFNEQKGEVIITRSLSAEDLSRRISAYIKSNTKPVLDVGGYYQENRRPES